MRVLVVDDEAPARERLKRLLGEIDGAEVVGEAVDGAAALAKQVEIDADVVLLDIRMPGMDGMACARELAKLPHPPVVIFTTAYSEHALEAFEAQAIDYLVKPVRRERLAQALERAERIRPVDEAPAEEGGRSALTVRRHGAIYLLPVADILYFQADQKYVTAYTTSGEEILEESLKQLEEEYGERFVRIHRAALVARTALIGMERYGEGSYRVLLRGGGHGPEISRRHLVEVRRLLKEQA